MAAAFLANCGLTDAQIARVTYLVGHHHTLRGIDGIDYHRSSSRRTTSPMHRKTAAAAKTLKSSSPKSCAPTAADALRGLRCAAEVRCGMRIYELETRPEPLLGRRLMTLAAEHYGVRELTVNEQNPQAVGFYEHLGFSVWKRTERDEEGGEYPLLYMRK